MDKNELDKLKNYLVITEKRLVIAENRLKSAQDKRDNLLENLNLYKKVKTSEHQMDEDGLLPDNGEMIEVKNNIAKLDVTIIPAAKMEVLTAKVDIKNLKEKIQTADKESEPSLKELEENLGKRRQEFNRNNFNLREERKKKNDEIFKLQEAVEDETTDDNEKKNVLDKIYKLQDEMNKLQDEINKEKLIMDEYTKDYQEKKTKLLGRQREAPSGLNITAKAAVAARQNKR